MHVLLIFVDGVGLGADDPAVNPLAAADTPTLDSLAGGRRWTASTGWQTTDRAEFIPTDAVLGVAGRPQSGTNQATILTGINVPAQLGYHFGPKPDAPTRALLEETNLFKTLIEAGRSADLINAYPPRLHHDINRGKTLRSSIQHAAWAAGLPMHTAEDLLSGGAMSEEWTGKAWREMLGYPDAPIFTPHEAGRRMVELSRGYEFAFFSHWYTDILGHRGPFEDAVRLWETIDGVMRGALEAWDDDEGLMVITSDHGNFEDLSHGKHTENLVPTVVVGAQKAAFADGLTDLSHITPKILRALGMLGL
ncbi:MAG: hypothetical protein MUF38_15500 [Anaerolineae bacterium]|nr:hypothetical protein [Anaerolineae bacterium]